MGKKASKKKPDARGFSITSEPRSKEVATESVDQLGDLQTTDPKISNCESPCANKITYAVDEKVIVALSTDESKESISQEHISSEITHIKKFNPDSAYRGQLFPSVPVEAFVTAVVPTSSLLHQLLNHVQSHGSQCFPESYACPVWSYERAMRVMHALGGAGLSVDIACAALLATAGYDERAAVEHAILTLKPVELPAGWCDSEPCSAREASTADSTTAGLSAQDLLLQENIALHKSKEKNHFEAIQRAKQLVASIRHENDTLLMSGQEQKQKLEPEPELDTFAVTQRFLELQGVVATLKSARGYLKDPREKGVLDGKLCAVGLLMADLRPRVDFHQLAGQRGRAEGRPGAEGESKSEGLLQEEQEMVEEENQQAAATEDEGGKLEAQVDQDQESEGGMLDMFDLEEEEEVRGLGGVGVQAEAPFHYAKSQAHVAPQKLLARTVADFRTFSYLGEQTAGYWRESVTMGPLLSATAKQLGVPRGTVFNITPSIYSADKESARELTCLRLLYEMGIAPQRLSPAALKQWGVWVEQDTSERERAMRVEAVKRVRAVEQAVEAGSRVQTRASRLGKSRKDEEGRSASKGRVPMTLMQLQVELAARRQQELLRLEHVREELPVVKESQQVAALIASHDISIICGETGSGKSTQVPQIIIRDTVLEEDEIINIIVTEPRRVAAVSVSQRVGEEMGDAGRLQEALCGYTVRLDSRVGPRCVVEYVTVGVLLRRIQSSKGECLAGYSHVIVDEVHERSVDSDVLLMMLKQYRMRALEAAEMRRSGEGVAERTFPRVVMMSATADVDAIAAYWGAKGNFNSISASASASASVGVGGVGGDGEQGELAVAHIPGRTFPVRVTFLEEAVLESGFSVELEAGGRRTQGGEYNARRDTINHISFAESLLVEESEGLEDEDEGSTIDFTRLHATFANLDLNRVNYELLFHVIKFELLREDCDATVGAVLVFMPGLEEIRRISQMVDNDSQLSKLVETVPMHSSLSFQDLQRAFRPASRHKRKLVISTNICETGVTIEDVDLVIDTGFVKSIEWNQVTEISRLRMHHCSIAEATQRRGRAGRVRPGRCVHLFPRYFVESSGGAEGGIAGDNTRMKRRPDPEIKRAPLTSPILSLVDQGFRPSMLLSAPGNVLAPSKLENATRTLVDLGAIVRSEVSSVSRSSADDSHADNQDDDVLSEHYLPTPLGRSLALLPCSPSSGIILIAARKLGCLQAAAVFVASLDCKSVFLKSEQSDAYFRHQFGKKAESDAVAIVNVYSEWHRAESKHKWCQRHGISMPAVTHLVKVADDLLKVVGQTHAQPQARTRPSATIHNQQCTTCLTNVGMHTCITGGGCVETLHAAITAGVGKNVSFRARPSASAAPGAPASFLAGNKSTTYCRVHPSSLVSNPGDWVVYYSQMKSQAGKQSLLNVSSINLFTALLFVPWARCYLGDGTVIIGRGIGIRCKPQTLVVLRRLKAQWERALTLVAGDADEDESAECIDIITRLITAK